MTPINIIKGASIQDMTARKIHNIYNYREHFIGPSPLKVLTTAFVVVLRLLRFDGAAWSPWPSEPLHSGALALFLNRGQSRVRPLIEN
jgi:hypothetical protein